MKTPNESWVHMRLKFLFKKRQGGAWGDEPEATNAVVCIRAADFETDKLRHKKTDLTRRSFTTDELANKCLQEGDLIIEKSGGGDNQPVGRIVLFSLDEPALCSNFLELLRPNQEIVYPPFAAYVLYSLWVSRKVIAAIKQTTGIQNLDLEEYLNIKVPIPPPGVQTRITHYLDKELVYIDKLVDAKEKLLKLLYEKRQALMTQAIKKGLRPGAAKKPSGIAWLEAIPAHWQIKKLKYLTTKIGSGVTPRGGAEVYVKEGVPLFRSQNIHFDGLKLDDIACIDLETHEAMAGSRVENGDVLLNITGASIGRCFYYEGQFEEANVNQHVCILRPNEKILTQYLYLFLASTVGQNQVAFSQVGGGREGLNFENIKSFIMPLPPIEEQQAILDWIAGLNKKIVALEQHAIESIYLLKKRRIALITSAVSGQLEIPVHT